VLVDQPTRKITNIKWTLGFFSQVSTYKEENMLQPQSNHYIVNSFVYHELPNGEIVVQNRFGIVKVKETRMIRIIKEWDRKTGCIVDDETLYKIFRGDSEIATKFLLQHGIIQKSEPMNFNINRLVFFSNHSDILKLIEKILLNDYSSRVKVEIHCLDDFSKDLISSHSCSLVFMNPYCKSTAKRIRDTIKDIPNSYVLMSYVYNNKYYIDSLYCGSWRNPCHLCHIGYIESQLRINTSGNITYQQMIDSLYHEDPSFKVEAALSINQQLNSVTQLFNRFEKLISLDTSKVVFPEEFHEFVVMDLETKEVHVDTSMHWEMCDCYEQ